MTGTLAIVALGVSGLTHVLIGRLSCRGTTTLLSCFLLVACFVRLLVVPVGLLDHTQAMTVNGALAILCQPLLILIQGRSRAHGSRHGTFLVLLLCVAVPSLAP